MRRHQNKFLYIILREEDKGILFGSTFLRHCCGFFKHKLDSTYLDMPVKFHLNGTRYEIFYTVVNTFDLDVSLHKPFS
jgi:hypothetical protein